MLKNPWAQSRLCVKELYLQEAPIKKKVNCRLAEARHGTIWAIGDDQFISQTIKPEGMAHRTGEGSWGEGGKLYMESSALGKAG